MARYWPDIAQGMLVTVEIALAVVVTGIALGLALAVLRSYRVRPVNALIVVFVDVFRALPPLVLILIIYFGLPNIGLNLSSYAVLWLVLSLVLGAFAEEIFWAGILSVRKGQWDAARSTGLGFGRTLLYVVLPQAVRLTVPPLTNRTIAITKNTALGTVIGVAEIINQAQTAVSFSGNATPLMMAARLHRRVHPGGAPRRSCRAPLRVAAGVMDVFLHQFLNLEIMRQAWPIIFKGLQMTALLCLAVIPLGLAGGLVLAIASLSGSAVLRGAVKGLIDLFRALPPLVLLILIYSGLPFAGLNLSPFAAVCLAFTLNTSSFYGEIYRAGIESRPRPVGGGALDRAWRRPHLRPRDPAAGGPQRAAGPRLEHRRGGEAHLDRQRGVLHRTPVCRRHGALGDLQHLADRACGGDLFGASCGPWSG